MITAVTSNASTPTGSIVTCDGCEYEARWGTDGGNRKDAIRGPHCTSCHSDDHRACEVCGDCLPDGHRYDRRYCSASCRVRAHDHREAAALERAVWEAEHPEQAAREEAELKQWQRELDTKLGALDPGGQRRERARRIAELKAQADRCAVCDEPFAATAIIYRRAERPPTGSVLPYCDTHRCCEYDGYHNADAPEGSYYPQCRCEGEHGDRKWTEPEPCANCGRLVSNDKATADPWRFTRQWSYCGEGDEPLPRAVCSENCRRAVFHAEKKAKRTREDRPCECCGEMFTPRRADARYCSGACRQRACRMRRAEA